MDWINTLLMKLLRFYRWIYFYCRHFFLMSYFSIRDLMILIYDRLKLFEIPFFFLFLCHHYSPKQFNPTHVPENIRTLVRARDRHHLTASRKGQLIRISHWGHRLLFSLWNTVLFGALQKRVEKVIFYSYLTLTLELNNPFDRGELLRFLDKKIALLNRLLDYVKIINGKDWDQSLMHQHIDVFRRNSLLQAEVIHNMRRAVRHAKEPEIIKNVKLGLIKGLYPILVTKGVSGSYWMRGPNREVLGLFKPFDEEIHAPNNPVGPRFQGALGLRKTRPGCRVGESPHHEVGAFVVDEFFGFGIVPKTHYACFEHQSFFLTREDRFTSQRVIKKKYGSFQEYVRGFVAANKLTESEFNSIPLDEFQLLVILDVIIGNTDRNIGNILFGDEKIAAIDHGLSFSDSVEGLSYWYWSYFPQGEKPLFKPFVDLLTHFPFEALKIKLRKKCFISLPSLDRMNERVVLFTEAIKRDLSPSQIVDLMAPKYLYPLKDRQATLQSNAKEQLENYLKDASICK